MRVLSTNENYYYFILFYFIFLLKIFFDIMFLIGELPINTDFRKYVKFGRISEPSSTYNRKHLILYLS